jgi:tetratricopeptide (TPR) repeat protein
MRDELDVAEKAHGELERLGDEYGAIWALRLCGCFHAWLGDSLEASRIWTDALPRAERISARLTSELMIWLLWEAWWGPEPAEEGIRRCDEYLERARRLGAKRLEGVALDMRAALKAYQGKLDDAHDDITAGRGILRELDDTIWWAGASMVEADLEFTAGDPQAAYDCLAAGHEALAGLAETGYLATVVGLRAQAAVQLGREDEALELADETERLAQQDDFEPLGRLQLVRALVLARRGEVERADELMREAVAYIAPTDYLVLVLELGFVEADIGRLLGRPEAERAGVERALAAAETKGNVVAAARARERLAKL